MEIRTIDGFLPYWESVRDRTRRVVARVPAERLEWSPGSGVLSPGDLVRHLAGIERWMYAETVLGRRSRYPGHGRELAEGLDAVVGYMERLHAESVELFATLSPEMLAARCETPAGTSITVAKWLRAMVEHEAHHRGQLYLLLRLCGVVTPPIYGLTSEQVAERSVVA